MGLRQKFKQPRRRSKTHGTGTGSTDGLIRCQLDARTTIWCKTKEGVKIAKQKWEDKKMRDLSAFHKNENTMSSTEKYKKNYVKQKNMEYRERKTKRDMI